MVGNRAMAENVMLNNVDHKNLRIITRRAQEYGDNVAGCVVFPTEFLEVHKEYPIYFQKDAETGQFQSIALFGFTHGENLLLDNSASGWAGRYIPALMRREPFLIGFNRSAEEVQPSKVLLDTSSPRISYGEEGEPVFLPGGGNSPFLEQIKKNLMLIHEGFPASAEMFRVFLDLDLIEPLTLDIHFDNGEHYTASNYYTINQDRLYSLGDDLIARLHKSGYLQLAYLVLFSLGNIKNLIDKRNSAHRASK